MKVSIVIPVFNEERAVRKTVEHIIEVMDSTGTEYEIIAVNDKSTDRSKEILETIEKVKLINNRMNQGYGRSLKNGIEKSNYDWILIIDADGTYPVRDIPRLIKHCPEHDMVIGARVGKHVSIPLLRRPAKLFLRLLANYISPIKIPDINSGLRIFKKEIALKHWNILPQRFSFTTTITLACATRGEYSIKYIPINYYKRKGKSSMRPLKDFVKFLNLTLKLCLYFKPLKVFVPIGLFLSMLGFILGLYRVINFLDVSESSIFLILSGLQILFMGFLAHMIVETRK
jgi:glycosyltransferase involved in cell wall biosynthesis